MKISTNLQEAINKQIGRETFSAHLYFNAAATLRESGLDNLAAMFEKHAHEERVHADKFYEYVWQRNGCPCYCAVEAAPTEFATLLEIAEAAYAHEQKVTGWINELYDLAVKEKDYAAQAFLDWFVAEQVEEERKSFVFLEQVKMTADVLILEKEAG